MALSTRANVYGEMYIRKKVHDVRGSIQTVYCKLMKCVHVAKERKGKRKKKSLGRGREEGHGFVFWFSFFFSKKSVNSFF